MLEQLRLLNQQPNNNLLELLSKANNPQQLIQNMIVQNPQLHGLVQQYGNGDPKAACYEYARQTGQNLDQILEILERYM